MVVIQMSGNLSNINIVEVYVPNTDAMDAEIDKFYNGISVLLKRFKKQDVAIIMGDFNAKIGKRKCGDLVSEYGLGVKNERGDRLKLSIEEKYLIVLNTFFKLPPQCLYAWTSPKDQPDGIVRNQIDYILILKRFRNSCLGVKTSWH